MLKFELVQKTNIQQKFVTAEKISDFYVAQIL